MKKSEFLECIYRNFHFLSEKYGFQKINPPQFIVEVWKDKPICYFKTKWYILIQYDRRENFLSVLIIKSINETMP